MSRPYAEVIGDPIAHSKSPAIHQFWLAKLGIEADYRACHVRPGELEGYFAQRREDAAWRGCNVTIPHKQAVIPLLDEIDSRARGTGAVNTITAGPDGRLIGTNTDVDGIAEALAGARLEAGKAVVIGSGGAARATFAYLAESACSNVHVVARSPDKAMMALSECGLEAEVHAFAGASKALSDATLLVNATQLGMEGQNGLPDVILQALDTLASDALVFDMVYAPLETQLLGITKRHGYATIDGLVMLIGQAAKAFEHFFGVAPPREHDDELRRMLVI